MASRRESTSFKSLAARQTSIGDDDDDGYCTLVDFAGNGGGGREGTNVGDDLVVLLYHLQHACKRIASLVTSPFNSSLGTSPFNSSLVADLHRTLLYGGVAMNPRDHLRLVYEGNPLAFLVEQAGGKASDGKREILSIQPVKLHQRLPLFLGSVEDVTELESYGDVQQTVNPGYEV